MAYQEQKKRSSPLSPPPHRRPGPQAQLVCRDRRRRPTAAIKARPLLSRVVCRPESSVGPSRPPARVVRRPESSTGPSHPPDQVVRRPKSSAGPSCPPVAGPSRPPARVVCKPESSVGPQPDRRHCRPGPLARVVHWPESSAAAPAQVVHRRSPSRPPARIVRRPESSTGGRPESSAGPSSLSARVVRRPTAGSLPLLALPAGPARWPEWSTGAGPTRPPARFVCRPESSVGPQPDLHNFWAVLALPSGPRCPLAA